MKKDYRSMLEVAEELMNDKRRKTPQSFKKLAEDVRTILGMSDEEFESQLAQFYADLSLSGKFINVGGDKWDLKYRQKFEVAGLQFQYDDEATIEDFEDDDEEEEDDDLEVVEEDPDDYDEFIEDAEI